MGRSKETFGKKEVRKKQAKKRKEKEAKRLARKDSDTNSNLDDMIAYVDEFGNITDTPPDETQKEKVKAEDIDVSVPKGGYGEDEPREKQGVVTFFNDQKGYGFIRNLSNNQNIFVHINEVDGEIKEGNRVTYEEGQGPKGPAAMNVKQSK
ncbi:cold-shock protein [Draconibacterium halophilum]|uniref:Cold shock domain-containing protein n=1 Tax=Draconibacterium halophilum TaxID=2706887 RepID=A0A6C0RFX1_9BACT|nr:cold shock domain-containing protein [Draconibacterium halophilum]QIA09039.1 cold shock domain-containing protein [Draconibacterium halophilum]